MEKRKREKQMITVIGESKETAENTVDFSSTETVSVVWIGTKGWNTENKRKEEEKES